MDVNRANAKRAERASAGHELKLSGELLLSRLRLDAPLVTAAREELLAGGTERRRHAAAIEYSTMDDQPLEQDAPPR